MNWTVESPYPYDILNKTWSYWSYQEIEKGCFNVALCNVIRVYSESLMVVSFYSYYRAGSKMLKMSWVLGIGHKTIFSQWYCGSSNLCTCGFCSTLYQNTIKFCILKHTLNNLTQRK